MLSFVQNWLTNEANPIGVDFGSDSLRLAQVELSNSEFRLVAAASAEIPASMREDKLARLAFLTQTARDLLKHGGFRGRRAILGLPASCMQIHHLRLPRTGDPTLRDQLPAIVRDHLKINPTGMLLRHLIAGPVKEDGVALEEVIVMAAQRSLVDELLHAAAKAKLDVIAMNVEPKAVVDCFSHVYRRRGDAERTNCFIDMGSSATRVVIARGQQILCGRILRLAGDHLSRAVATELRTTPEAARALRVQNSSAGTSNRKNLAASGRSIVPEAGQAAVALSGRIDQACRGPLETLIAALTDCRRDHETSFPGSRIDHLIFVGGEACDRALCQTIADRLGLPSHSGDPLVRMGRISKVSIESGIDRRKPQPAWAVAIGLSMGPASAGAVPAVNKAS
jgi:Tfp pilus assembly PilM family ATPase